MEKIILNIANQIIKTDFMQYPDQEQVTDLAGALTVILAEHLPDTDTGEIYDYLQTKIIEV